MVVRRNSARRRRLVADPMVPTSGALVEPAPSTPPKRKTKKTQESDTRAYSYGADRRNQRKTTDLIPKRVLSYLLVVLVLLGCLGLILFLASHAEQWRNRIGDVGVAALSIRGHGSLASWFSSFLLIITGLASIQIYALRQHRCDDYRGTYRLWLWMAGLFLVASVNCVVNLGAVGANLVASFAPNFSSTRAWIPWVIKLTALSLLVIRGMYEIRKSRGSLAWVVFVWFAYTGAIILQWPPVKESMVNLGSDMAVGNCWLFGTAALLLAHLTYARFIYLRAHGLIKLKTKTTAVKSKKKKVIAKKKASSSKTKVAGVEAAKPTKKKRTKTTVQSSTKKTASTDAVRSSTKESPKASPASTQPSQPVSKKKNQDVQSSNSKLSGGRDSGSGEKSPSDVLRELAAASRAKTSGKGGSESNASKAVEASEEQEPEIIKMTKTQRRKQRKLDKQRRRAA